MVPIYAIALVIAHAGEKYAACLSLLDNVFNYLGAPVEVFSVIEWVFSYSHGVSRTEDYTAMTADAVFFAASYLVIGSVISVHIKTALIDAHLTLYTAVCIPFYYEFRWQISLYLYTPIYWSVLTGIPFSAR